MVTQKRIQKIDEEIQYYLEEAKECEQRQEKALQEDDPVAATRCLYSLRRAETMAYRLQAIKKAWLEGTEPPFAYP